MPACSPSWRSRAACQVGAAAACWGAPCTEEAVGVLRRAAGGAAAAAARCACTRTPCHLACACFRSIAAIIFLQSSSLPTTEAEAAEQLAEMTRQGRYVRDIWS